MKRCFLQGYGPFKNVLNILVAAAFLVNFVLNDAGAAIQDPGLQRLYDLITAEERTLPEIDIETFNLPAYLGTVKFFSKGASDKFVIHIQDAHCNYAAQKKTAEIIDYLVKEYGIKCLNLEGGSGEYDTGVFTSIPDKELRARISDLFVGQGVVNGAEYFAINNPGDVMLWGLEEPGLYVENLTAYRDNLKNKQDEDRYIGLLSTVLGSLKTHIYPKELLELDRKYELYKSDGMQFKDYLSYLIGAAKDRLIDIKSFPNIYLLYQSMQQEGTIDFKRANAERDALIAALQGMLSKKSLEELVMRTIEYRSKRISQYEFYDFIVKKAKLSSVKLGEYPEFLKYTIYISLYYSADRSKVISEMSDLEDSIKETLFKDDKERELSKLSKNLTLMKRLFAISLTKEDYLYYTKNRGQFDMDGYVSFIRKEAPLYKIDAPLDEGIRKLDGYREGLARFYEYSFKRDDEFMRNIVFTGEGQKTAIVVTGGFHTENLCDLYRKNDISYVSIMPSFTSEEGYESPYFKLLGGEEGKIYGKLAAMMAETSEIQIASMLSGAISADVWGRRNIDAFKAAVILQSQLAKGAEVTDVSRAGDDIVVSMADGRTARMPMNKLLNAVHQKYTDKQMEDLDKSDQGAFEDIPGIDAMVEEVLGDLETMGAKHEDIIKLKDSLKGANGKGRAWIRTVKGVTFMGHAGGEGIRLNAGLKGDAQAMMGVLIHELVAGLYGDHMLAGEAERLFREGKSSPTLLASARAFDKPVWKMTAAEREIAERDYAMSEDAGEARRRRLEIRTEQDWAMQKPGKAVMAPGEKEEVKKKAERDRREALAAKMKKIAGDFAGEGAEIYDPLTVNYATLSDILFAISNAAAVGTTAVAGGVSAQDMMKLYEAGIGEAHRVRMFIHEKFRSDEQERALANIMGFVGVMKMLESMVPASRTEVQDLLERISENIRDLLAQEVADPANIGIFTDPKGRGVEAILAVNRDAATMALMALRGAQNKMDKKDIIGARKLCEIAAKSIAGQAVIGPEEEAVYVSSLELARITGVIDAIRVNESGVSASDSELLLRINYEVGILRSLENKLARGQTDLTPQERRAALHVLQMFSAMRRPDSEGIIFWAGPGFEGIPAVDSWKKPAVLARARQVLEAWGAAKQNEMARKEAEKEKAREEARKKSDEEAAAIARSREGRVAKAEAQNSAVAETVITAEEIDAAEPIIGQMTPRGLSDIDDLIETLKTLDGKVLDGATDAEVEEWESMNAAAYNARLKLKSLLRQMQGMGFWTGPGIGSGIDMWRDRVLLAKAALVVQGLRDRIVEGERKKEEDARTKAELEKQKKEAAEKARTERENKATQERIAAADAFDAEVERLSEIEATPEELAATKAVVAAITGAFVNRAPHLGHLTNYIAFLYGHDAGLKGGYSDAELEENVRGNVSGKRFRVHAQIILERFQKEQGIGAEYGKPSVDTWRNRAFLARVRKAMETWKETIEKEEAAKKEREEKEAAARKAREENLKAFQLEAFADYQKMGDMPLHMPEARWRAVLAGLIYYRDLAAGNAGNYAGTSEAEEAFYKLASRRADYYLSDAGLDRVVAADGRPSAEMLEAEIDKVIGRIGEAKTAAKIVSDMLSAGIMPRDWIVYRAAREFRVEGRNVLTANEVQRIVDGEMAMLFEGKAPDAEVLGRVQGMVDLQMLTELQGAALADIDAYRANPWGNVDRLLRAVQTTEAVEKAFETLQVFISLADRVNMGLAIKEFRDKQLAPEVKKIGEKFEDMLGQAGRGLDKVESEIKKAEQSGKLDKNAFESALQTPLASLRFLNELVRRGVMQPAVQGAPTGLFDMRSAAEYTARYDRMQSRLGAFYDRQMRNVNSAATVEAVLRALKLDPGDFGPKVMEADLADFKERARIISKDLGYGLLEGNGEGAVMLRFTSETLRGKAAVKKAFESAVAAGNLQGALSALGLSPSDVTMPYREGQKGLDELQNAVNMLVSRGIDIYGANAEMLKRFRPESFREKVALIEKLGLKVDVQRLKMSDEKLQEEAKKGMRDRKRLAVINAENVQKGLEILGADRNVLDSNLINLAMKSTAQLDVALANLEARGFDVFGTGEGLDIFQQDLAQVRLGLASLQQAMNGLSPAEARTIGLNDLSPEETIVAQQAALLFFSRSPAGIKMRKMTLRPGEKERTMVPGELRKFIEGLTLYEMQMAAKSKPTGATALTTSFEERLLGTLNKIIIAVSGPEEKVAGRLHNLRGENPAVFDSAMKRVIKKAIQMNESMTSVDPRTGKKLHNLTPMAEVIKDIRRNIAALKAKADAAADAKKGAGKEDAGMRKAEGAIANGSLKESLDKVGTAEDLAALAGEEITMDADAKNRIEKAMDFLYAKAASGTLSDSDREMVEFLVGSKNMTEAERREVRDGRLNEIYFFSAKVSGEEDYLLGFSALGRTGIARELVMTLSPSELAEYLFHEFLEPRVMDHAKIYGKEDIAASPQRRIFGAANPLKTSLRDFINREAKKAEMARVAPAVPALAAGEREAGAEAGLGEAFEAAPADTVEARKETAVKAGEEIERRKDPVKVIVGIAYDESAPEVFNSMDRAAKKFNSEVKTKFGSEKDNQQIIVFKMIKGDKDATAKEMKNAMDRALRTLPADGKGNVILYAPETEDLTMAEYMMTREEYDAYRKDGRITMIKDGYTDAYGRDGKPYAADIATRFVIGRHIAFCMNADTDASRQAGLDTLGRLLSSLTGEDLMGVVKNIKDVEALKSFLSNIILKINPIDFGELSDYEDMQVAVAVSL